MNIKNRKKTHRFLTVVTTLLFAFSVFTVAAFATTGTDSSSLGSAASENSSSSSQPSENTTTPTNTPSDSSSSSSALEPGTGGNVTPNPESSSGASSAGSPTGNTSSGKEASSAKPKPPVNQKPVDTQTRRVEAIASQAEQATSDPGVLSSQDWSELLSSGSSSQPQGSSAAGTVSDSASSQSTGSGGGISWFLIAGIILIVLALCGIAFFIYEQFIKNDDDPFGSPRDISSRSSGKPARRDPESTEFTDISSNSEGHVGESGLESISAPAATTPAAAPQTPAAPVKQPEVSSEPKAPAEPEAPAAQPVQEAVKPQPEVAQPAAPAVQEKLPGKAPAPEPAKEALPKSQATPVTESNFDWEKFFNEDEDK